MSAQPDWMQQQQHDDQSRALAIVRLLDEAEEALGKRGARWREELTAALWTIPAPEKAGIERRPF